MKKRGIDKVEKLFVKFCIVNSLDRIQTFWFTLKSESMQKIILRYAGKNASMAVTALLYFAALTMFSFVCTQN